MHNIYIYIERKNYRIIVYNTYLHRNKINLVYIPTKAIKV